MRTSDAVELGTRIEPCQLSSAAAIESQVASSPDWTPMILTPPDIGNIMVVPGRYKVSLHHRDEDLTIGWLDMAHVPPLPLSPDRIAAIRSNPAALKHARVTIECNKCHDGLRPYTGLERNDDYERKGYIWYKELPDAFDCSCGQVTIDLTLLRDHFHGVLGGLPDVDGSISLASTNMYQKSKLEALCSGFTQKLDQNPQEEEVQKFIEENPVLMHRFAPKRIFFKAPILASFKTDIAILTQTKELLLIELERPGIQLMKGSGGMCAELQRPLDQVKDWLHRAEDHKPAVLEEIGNLALSDVTKIRGVVIAGRDKGYDEEHLRHLKWTDFGSNIEFLTFDDLIGSLVSLVRALGNL